MTEILFILTTIFVAYVIYSIADGQKTAASSPVPPPASPAEPPVAKAAPVAKAVSALAPAKPAAVPVSAEPAVPVAVKPVAEPAAAIAQAAPVAVKPAAEPAPTPAQTVAAKGSVRNPKTGEVATVTNNYRFTKRWIKEALVAEGLLTKIYKNNELDTAAEAAIKTALLELAAMAKYQA